VIGRARYGVSYGLVHTHANSGIERCIRARLACIIMSGVPPTLVPAIIATRQAPQPIRYHLAFNKSFVDFVLRLSLLAFSLPEPVVTQISIVYFQAENCVILTSTLSFASSITSFLERAPHVRQAMTV